MIDIAHLRSMMHSPVSNYVVPGLTSWLIGEPSPKGTLRFFDCSREHQEAITPHSHRFDFQCWVLKGRVRNRIWTSSYGSGGDRFAHTNLVYQGECGKYEKVFIGNANYNYADTVYEADAWYSMKAREIHSIYFSRGTQVLFFEGPTTTNQSLILEPVVDGEVIPTFEVKPWMFRREAIGTDSSVASVGDTPSPSIGAATS